MIHWWDADSSTFKFLTDGLTDLNEDLSRLPDPKRYAAYARALEAFATGYCYGRYGLMPVNIDRNGIEREWGYAQRIRHFAGEFLSSDAAKDFRDSGAVRALIALHPPIYDEEKVERSCRAAGLDPGYPPEEVKNRHRGVHREAVRTFSRATALPTTDNLTAAMSALGGLLNLIHCNVKHPGKALGPGPYREMGHRNRMVVSLALPVIADVLALALDMPDHRLAVYGSLRKGKSNHAIIAGLGDPLDVGFITGKVREREGYPVYTWTLPGCNYAVEVYGSVSSDMWNTLDDFEGPAYRRMMVPVLLPNGRRIVATAYVGTEP